MVSRTVLLLRLLYKLGLAPSKIHNLMAQMWSLADLEDYAKKYESSMKKES